MGKRNYFLCAILAILLLSSCSKTQRIEPNIPLQKVLVEYESGQVNAFAASGNGAVFIFTIDRQAVGSQSSGNVMNQYDAQGKLIKTFDLGGLLMIQSAAADSTGDIVYFTAQGRGNFLSLFSLDTSTGQVDRLYDFSFFKTAKAMVLLDGRIYLLGQQQWVYSYANVPGEYDFSGKERLVYYSLETGEAYGIGLEYPINIAPGRDGILDVLGYFPGEGYCIMEYDPAGDKLDIMEHLEEYKFDYFAVCNQGESLIYGYGSNQYGLLLADHGNLELEVEIYQNGGFSRPVAYVGGMVYCIDESLGNDGGLGRLVGFPLDAVQRRNEEIRIISIYSPMAPYSCGYALERSDFSWDELVLKVLAQDRNYDLCVGISSYGGSLVMRESNAFYPLNDIPGIKEYLERCFPYIYEAAMNDNGAIWMFPYAIGMRGIAVQEGTAKKMGVSFRDNMSFSELESLICSLSDTERRKACLLPSVFANSYALQYFSHNTSAEDASFMENMESILRMYQMLPLNNFINLDQDILCNDVNIGLYDHNDHILLRYDAVYSLPKGNSSDKNVATCYFLAANPNSPHLQEALDYIADLIAYLMNKPGIWYFQDFEAWPDSIAAQIHGLYEDAEICFGIDEDVYMDGLGRMLGGELSVEEFAREASRRLKIYLGE